MVVPCLESLQTMVFPHKPLCGTRVNKTQEPITSDKNFHSYLMHIFSGL